MNNALSLSASRFFSPRAAQGRRAFVRVALALCVLSLSACATAGERVGQLAEVQERDRKVLDMRLSRVEERLDGVEQGLNEVRSTLAEQVASRQTAARQTREATRQSRAATRRSSERLPAEPQITGTRPLGDIPSPADIPYLPKADMLDMSGVGSRSNLAPAAFEASPASPPASPSAASSAPSSARLPAPLASPALGSAQNAGPGLEPANLSAPDAASARNKAPRSNSGAAAYDKALALYNKGNYSQAAQDFAAFIQANPASPLAANALYWQGECSYSQGKYSESIILFKDVAAKYPKHAKAAASLLKAGYAYERMSDMENARFYWQILLDDYPGSAPAALARKKMTS